MKLLLIQVCLFCILTPIVSCRNEKLSALTINGKKRNGKIMSRYPDYGDGRPDGCLVRPEMFLQLNTKTKGFVSGIVSDIDTGERLVGNIVSIVTQFNDTIKIPTDSLGCFRVAISGRIKYINLEQAPYRMLNAKL